jgi:DNA-binding NarL/FixJ family response regulator
MIRVLLADDHPVVRSGYLRLLEQEHDIRVIAEAATGEDAYAAFVADPPDVLATDLSMPGGGGLELIRRVLLRAPEARILVFSMYDSPPLVRRALEAGARGFLTKAAAPQSLVDAVRVLQRGGRYLGTGLEGLREFEIFRLLAQGHSAAECARALKLSTKTVSNHQTSIKEKLGVTTSAALAHLAIRHRVIVSALA